MNGIHIETYLWRLGQFKTVMQHVTEILIKGNILTGDVWYESRLFLNMVAGSEVLVKVKLAE